MVPLGQFPFPPSSLFGLQNTLMKRSSLLGLTIASVLAFGSNFPDANGQMIVAHRGASHDAPENTMAAFNLAWELGSDGVEGDFYLTKDNQIVCIHDRDTKRTGGEPAMVVESSTLEELRQREYGKWKNEKFAGEPLPTFAEVLKSIPEDKKFIIELKSGPKIVPFLKEELEKNNADVSRMLIIAFNTEVVKECKRLLPDYRVHWLTGFKQDRKDGAWHPNAAQVVETYKTIGADGVGMQGNRMVVNEDFVKTLKDGGVQEFHVWTINSPEDAKYLQSLGPIGITTDRPDLIRSAIFPKQ